LDLIQHIALGFALKQRVHTIAEPTFLPLRYAIPIETGIPALLRRQRNQRRLTLEMLPKKKPDPAPPQPLVPSS
jgi:hypothetical protein